MGIAVAFFQQFRFAALESVSDPALYGPALSVIMGGGLFSAFLGPEIGERGATLFTSLPPFAGSFLLLGGLIFLAIFIFQFYRETPIEADTSETPGRPLLTIIHAPQFFIPSLCAAIGFGVMSFIMTATPSASPTIGNSFHPKAPPPPVPSTPLRKKPRRSTSVGCIGMTLWN